VHLDLVPFLFCKIFSLERLFGQHMTYVLDFISKLVVRDVNCFFIFIFLNLINFLDNLTSIDYLWTL